MPVYRCPHCHYRGQPLRYAKGYLIIEVALWMTFFVPGFFYSLWRATAKTCPRCGREMRRMDSILNEPFHRKVT
jgi:hypothetical protein